MFSPLDRAMHDWDWEVQAEATRLIEAGVPPYNALEQAHNNVSRRRQAKQAIIKSGLV